MPQGYVPALYFMPFNHRGSSSPACSTGSRRLALSRPPRSPAPSRSFTTAFARLWPQAVLVDKAGLLIDEEFSATILRDAKAKGFTMARPGLHRVRSGPDGVLETADPLARGQGQP